VAGPLLLVTALLLVGSYGFVGDGWFLLLCLLLVAALLLVGYGFVGYMVGLFGFACCCLVAALLLPCCCLVACWLWYCWLWLVRLALLFIAIAIIDFSVFIVAPYLFFREESIAEGSSVRVVAEKEDPFTKLVLESCSSMTLIPFVELSSIKCQPSLVSSPIDIMVSFCKPRP
jgi:hypothetical protein